MDAVGGYTLFLNRDFLASILCNLNTDTKQHLQNTRLVLPLNTNKYIKQVKQWNTKQSETIAKDGKKLSMMICIDVLFFFTRKSGQQTTDECWCKTIERNRRVVDYVATILLLGL